MHLALVDAMAKVVRKDCSQSNAFINPVFAPKVKSGDDADALVARESEDCKALLKAAAMARLNSIPALCVASVGCAFTLMLLMFWIRLDIETGLIDAWRRTIRIGDALLPTIGAVRLLLSALWLGVSAFRRPSLSARDGFFRALFLDGAGRARPVICGEDVARPASCGPVRGRGGRLTGSCSTRSRGNTQAFWRAEPS